MITMEGEIGGRWSAATCRLAYLEGFVCALAMSVGSFFDRSITGMPPMVLCGDFFPFDVATAASRIEFMARTMPFMLLGGALAIGSFALLVSAKPVRVGLSALVMLTGMVVGHALTMGMGPLAELFGSSGGMVVAHCLATAGARWGRRALPDQCGTDTLRRVDVACGMHTKRTTAQ